MKQPRILVVESDNDQRRRISAWLDDEGYEEVMFCPGPGAPDYTCLGGRGVACPLSNAADVVVVDLRLRSDEMLAGTPGWQLLLHYFEQGKRIVALCGDDDPVRLSFDDRFHAVRRPVERERFLEAVRASASFAST